ncbi:hypothetical protein Tco_0939437 [Tanacetum coccineum]|uniref:Uncharacterized protein n=1 Tax=Tanacetum coccineum TaxID=301880 RepID=A0ABQ5DMG3_9ASTR
MLRQLPEEKAQRRVRVKKKKLFHGILLKHQLKFNSIKDAKSLLQAVEKSHTIDVILEGYGFKWQLAMISMRARVTTATKGTLCKGEQAPGTRYRNRENTRGCASGDNYFNALVSGNAFWL